jgi:ABC-2 type transport system ATP-binding protein
MAKFYKSIYKNFSTERYEAIKQIFSIDEKRQIRKLSKGMKKQVAFWLSMSAMPDVLILDEPLDGLDPVMRKQVLNLVIADVAERDMTVLVSSHNLRELEDICDWVGIIHQGHMIIEKPLDDLKGSVQKYQIVLTEEQASLLQDESDILHISRTGTVYSVIIKGESQSTDVKMQSFGSVLCERISLSLEEVFIYELGGLGYDFKSIIV